jgi:deferrochelatase/peroxidase EfeB
MFGRWKSGELVPSCRFLVHLTLLFLGAPIDITPYKDDPDLANDPESNNNFDFSRDKTQNRCPFAAHIRKSNPRSDLSYFGGTTIRRIWRQGIPFGPEVTQEEHKKAKTLHTRGLLFACYQSSIDNGFSFIQQGAVSVSTSPCQC